MLEEKTGHGQVQMLIMTTRQSPLKFLMMKLVATGTVSDKALKATIELCVDICKRNGIKKLNYTGDKSGKPNNAQMVFQQLIVQGHIWAVSSLILPVK